MQYSAMLAIPHLNSDKINRNQEDKAALITYNVQSNPRTTPPPSIQQWLGAHRHGVSSIPEWDLTGNSESGIVFFNGIDKFGIEVSNKNKKIYKVFYDNPTWNINYSEQVFQIGSRSRYSENLLMVESINKERVGKMELMNLEWKNLMWN